VYQVTPGTGDGDSVSCTVAEDYDWKSGSLHAQLITFIAEEKNCVARSTGKENGGVLKL